MVDSTRIRLPNYLVGTDLGSIQPELDNTDNQANRIEVLESRLDDLQAKHKDINDRTLEDEKAQASFTQQFLPGRTYLQGLLYADVYKDTCHVTSSFQTFFPGGVTSIADDTATVGFDISNDLQHAYYDISAYCLDPARILVYNGSIIVGSDLSVGIVRVFKTRPDRLETFLTIYNVGAATDVYVRVKRKIGLT